MLDDLQTPQLCTTSLGQQALEPLLQHLARTQHVGQEYAPGDAPPACVSRKHSASSARFALRLLSVCIQGLCVLTQPASAIAPTGVQGVAAIHTAEPLVTPALGCSVGTGKVKSRCNLGHEAVVGDDSFWSSCTVNRSDSTVGGSTRYASVANTTVSSRCNTGSLTPSMNRCKIS